MSPLRLEIGSNPGRLADTGWGKRTWLAPAAEFGLFGDTDGQTHSSNSLVVPSEPVEFSTGKDGLAPVDYGTLAANSLFHINRIPSIAETQADRAVA